MRGGMKASPAPATQHGEVSLAPRQQVADIPAVGRPQGAAGLRRLLLAMLVVVICPMLTQAAMLYADGYFTCSMAGTWHSASHSCRCLPDHLGPYCQFSHVGTCSGNGRALADGSCECHADFGGDHCQCAAGRAGARCQYAGAEHCSGQGAVRDDGSCVCGRLYSGTRCESYALVTGAGSVMGNLAQMGRDAGSLAMGKGEELLTGLGSRLSLDAELTREAQAKIAAWLRGGISAEDVMLQWQGSRVEVTLTDLIAALRESWSGWAHGGGAEAEDGPAGGVLPAGQGLTPGSGGGSLLQVCYSLMDVDAAAGKRAVAQRYRALAKAAHPDQGGQAARMASLNLCKEVIMARLEHG